MKKGIKLKVLHLAICSVFAGNYALAMAADADKQQVPVKQAPRGLENDPKKIKSAGDEFADVNMVRNQIQNSAGTSAVPSGNSAVVLPPLPNGQAAGASGNTNQILPPSVEQVRQESFDALINTTMPMTPEQIVKLRKIIDAQQRAKSTLPYTPPKPVVTSMVVRGDPGETPPVVRLAKNFVTTVVFADSTGKPWPISSYGSGNDGMFETNVPDVANSPNVLTISTSSNYGYGNVLVGLNGRSSPIMITLVSDQKYIDYLANVRVLGRGPNAEAPVIYTAPNVEVSGLLTEILDGVTPANAVRVNTNDDRITTWQVGEQYYIRTKLTLLSPSWTQHYSSPDGMNAYEIRPTPIVMASENGQLIQIKIGD